MKEEYRELFELVNKMYNVVMKLHNADEDASYRKESTEFDEKANAERAILAGWPEFKQTSLAANKNHETRLAALEAAVKEQGDSLEKLRAYVNNTVISRLAGFVREVTELKETTKEQLHELANHDQRNVALYEEQEEFSADLAKRLKEAVERIDTGHNALDKQTARMAEQQEFCMKLQATLEAINFKVNQLSKLSDDQEGDLRSLKEWRAFTLQELQQNPPAEINTASGLDKTQPVPATREAALAGLDYPSPALTVKDVYPGYADLSVPAPKGLPSILNKPKDAPYKISQPGDVIYVDLSEPLPEGLPPILPGFIG